MPKAIIIPTEEQRGEGPQLTISADLDPAPSGEIVNINISSDKLLVSAPTVIIQQYKQKETTDITHTLQTQDNINWKGTYTVISGYDGMAKIKIFNAVDRDWNRGDGEGSFNVEEAAGEAGEVEEVEEIDEAEEKILFGTPLEYETIPWYDIRGEYAQKRKAPSLSGGGQFTDISKDINYLAGDFDSIWIGTNYGIGRNNKWENRGSTSGDWIGYLNEISGIANNISCIAPDGDLVWYGSPGGGLIMYDKTNGTWLGVTTKQGLYDNNINDILVDNDYLWIATNRGISKLNKQTKEWTNYTEASTHQGMISEKVTQIKWYYPKLWIGTDRGLISYDPLVDRWNAHTDICQDEITELLIDGTNLWIGTKDKGVIRYNLIDGNYDTISELFSNSILSLGNDSNYIWVGHPGGISRLDKLTQRWTAFTHTMEKFAIRELDDVQAIYSEQEQTLWVGMNTGLIELKEMKLIELTKPVITKLEPELNVVVNSGFPKIIAEYEDNIGGSGIDTFAIRLLIDGEDVTGDVQEITPKRLTWQPVYPLLDGEHWVEVQISDNSGNNSFRRNKFMVSTTLPSISVTVIPDWVIGTMTVRVNSDLELKGTPTVIAYYGDTYTTISFPAINTSTLSWQGTITINAPADFEGKGTITITGLEDIYGRPVETKTCPEIFTVDTNRPEPGTITLPVSGYDISTKTISTIGQAEPNSFVELFINGSSTGVVLADEQTGNFSFLNIELRNGTNTLMIWTIDRVGNKSPSSEITIFCDTQPPTIKITSPPNGSVTNSATIQVTGTMTDEYGISGVMVHGAAASISGENFQATVTLTQGTNTILATATDRTGNVGTDSMQILCDTQAPTIKITPPPNGSVTNSATIQVTGTMTDEYGISRVMVHGAAANILGGNFQATVTLTPGTNTILA
ncbi:hypothetical protein HY792_05310, partial [Candidatus Desantisbacteria bacterium]|nr:hypothetical protein [Candidatus Desantisbacteria bacterium]